MYIAGANAQFEIHTLAGVEINTCLFQTGCQLSSAASVPLLKLCLLAQFLWRETNVLDNCQMALLPRIERREFNLCMVHGNFSVPFYFGVVTVFLCQSINKKAHQICTYVYMGVSMYVCVCVYVCIGVYYLPLLHSCAPKRTCVMDDLNVWFDLTSVKFGSTRRSMIRNTNGKRGGCVSNVCVYKYIQAREIIRKSSIPYHIRRK